MHIEIVDYSLAGNGINASSYFEMDFLRAQAMAVQHIATIKDVRGLRAAGKRP